MALMWKKTMMSGAESMTEGFELSSVSRRGTPKCQLGSCESRHVIMLDGAPFPICKLPRSWKPLGTAGMRHDQASPLAEGGACKETKAVVGG